LHAAQKKPTCNKTPRPLLPTQVTTTQTKPEPHSFPPRLQS
jgi:hypothetical protein